MHVSFVLFVFIRNDIETTQRHKKDTRTLPYSSRTLSPTISVTPRETLYTQRDAARTKTSKKSRQNVNEENVHQMELLKVPEIMSEVENSLRAVHQRASTSQRLATWALYAFCTAVSPCRC